MTNKQLPSKREIIPTSSDSTPKQQDTFSDGCKRQAVARLRSGEQSTTDLAVELGIRRNLLYNWTDKLGKQAPDKKLRSRGRQPTSELSEVEQLRLKLAKAEQELDILKKFDAYLTRLKT